MITKVVKFLIAIIWIPLVVSQFVPEPQYCPETGGTICERVDNYPEEHIYQLMSRTKRGEFNFTSLLVDEHDLDDERIRRFLYEGSNHVQKRQQFIPPRKPNDAIQACQSDEHDIAPLAALNANNEWKYIVNVQKRDTKFRQLLRVQVCSHIGEACVPEILLPFGFINKCEQKFQNRKLLAVDADGKGTSTDVFSIPSCCVCNLYGSHTMR